MKRIDKHNYYLNIALEVSRRGTCLRRNYGAVIVNHDQIISTGYTGAPRGTINCVDLGWCPRKKAKIPAGERYELCRSVHAEMNAIIHASRSEALGGTMYLLGLEYETGEIVTDCNPCKLCTRVIINAGLSNMVTRGSQGEIITYHVEDWIANEEIDFDISKKSGFVELTTKLGQ